MRRRRPHHAIWSVVVNPPENEGNTADLPATFGSEQADIVMDAQPGGADTTDATGLAVITDDLEAGELSLVVDGGPSIAEIYPGFPIHYAVGGDIVEIASDGDATLALNTDNTIVFFEE